MAGTLLDTGPLVAYLWRRDHYHDWATAAFAMLEPPVITCEAVLSETCFLIVRNGLPASGIFGPIERGRLRIGLQLQDEAEPIRALMRLCQCADVAGRCLPGAVAELTDLPICTLDSDFTIYRAHGRRVLTLITPERRSLHEL